MGGVGVGAVVEERALLKSPTEEQGWRVVVLGGSLRPLLEVARRPARALAETCRAILDHQLTRRGSLKEG